MSLFCVGSELPFEADTADQLPIKRYSINLMWVNSRLDSKKFIRYDRENDVKIGLIRPVIEWAKANPEADVSLWYDKNYTSSEALKNTQDILERYAQEEGVKNATMRDIREIPIVAKNPDIFSEYLPIYFRVDVLKGILVVHSIEADGNDAAIFSDLEVGDRRLSQDRMNKAELFDSETMEKLNKYGMVMNQNDLMVENQFLQAKKNNNIIKSLKEILINANLFRAQYALNTPGFWQLRLTSALDSTKDVYDYYLALSLKKEAQARLGAWNGTNENDWIPYEPGQENVYWPLGNILSHESKPCVRLQNSKVVEVQSVFKWPTRGFGLYPPARDVDVRGSRLQYKWQINVLPPEQGKFYQVTYWK